MLDVPKVNWAPTASLEALQARAEMLAQIREFFKVREVLEVETPLLCETAASDPHIQAMSVVLDKTYYLQTSPEYPMKRLLSAGSGSIYQISKAFRREEKGRIHHPEFTILEWYRLDFDHHLLMDEMDALLQAVLNTKPAQKIAYQDLFEVAFNVNPHTLSLPELKEVLNFVQIHVEADLLETLNRDDILNLLLSHEVEPKLGWEAPVMIYDYPASQAALAKIRAGEIPVAERFELYIQGLELANGYHELTDGAEQLARFKADNMTREQLGLNIMPVDYDLVDALNAGLPACAGVALGLDRLLMLKLGKTHLNEVLSFAT